VLYDLGCNLSDCSMSLLRNQFAMILLVDAPDELAPDRVEAALAIPARDLGLGLTVREVSPAPAAHPSQPYVLSIYGADRPGIVYRLSAALAAQGVNITDLASHLVGEQIYAVLMEVDLPPDVDPSAIETSVRGIAGELGVDVTMRSAEASEL
jgi:glycine cleavage system transcriptional repressor